MIQPAIAGDYAEIWFARAVEWKDHNIMFEVGRIC